MKLWTAYAETGDRALTISEINIPLEEAEAAVDLHLRKHPDHSNVFIEYEYDDAD